LTDHHRDGPIRLPGARGAATARRLRRSTQRQSSPLYVSPQIAQLTGYSQEDKIDLLLTDVVLPGMGGYDVATKVAVTRPEIKILFMSGYAEEALARRPAFAGAALIEKPVADVLARRVRESLES
jgi:CheY-like chemotaxis protein